MARAKTPVKTAELFDVADLKPHPRNYRNHPQSQIDHLRHSLREFGFYRNVVLAKDLTILAGHGIVEAAQQEGIKQVPGVKLNISAESGLALKLLAGDNYLSYFAEDDDRALTELLKELAESDLTLLGTGFCDRHTKRPVTATLSSSPIELGAELASKLHDLIGLTAKISDTCEDVCRLASKHHRLMVAQCNRELSDVEEDMIENVEQRITQLVDSLPETELGPLVAEFQGDPRGATVKLLIKDVESHVSYDGWAHEAIIVPAHRI